MPTKEQILGSIVEELKNSGVNLRHPETEDGTSWGMSPERSAKHYLRGPVYNAIRDARYQAREYWGKVQKTENNALDFDQEQTGAIFDQLDEVISNGKNRQAQNLRRMGINNEVLFSAEESLLRQ